MQWLKNCYTQPLLNPRISLICVFVAWKLLLLCVAAASPGPGYDTSTELHLSGQEPPGSFLGLLALKLTRWDAIYFTAAAARGYVYEQEWAFASLTTLLTRGISKFLNLEVSNICTVALVAISIAHICHLLSVLCLYQLGLLVLQPKSNNNNTNRAAFVAACLHVIAPAGLFLSAPNSESLYSFLSFAAAVAYASSFRVAPDAQHRSIRDDGFLVLSGLLFGATTSTRANGLFNGLVYVYDAVTVLLNLPRLLGSWPWMRYALCVGISGTLTGLGFALPQYLAYRDFCMGDRAEVGLTPWCTAMPPSIYTYVQDVYWQNGFLRYWKLSNLPLFALAAPTILILQYSGIHALTGRLKDDSPRKKQANAAQVNQKLAAQDSLTRLALPQLFIATMAITNFHVQIITRLASGYPVAYLWLARELGDQQRYTRLIVRWMIVYAIVQGGLYASFLPPA